MKLDDDIHEIARLDALRVAPEVIRSFEAGPDGLEFLAFGPRRDGDGEVFPGWWSDWASAVAQRDRDLLRRRVPAGRRDDDPD